MNSLNFIFLQACPPSKQRNTQAGNILFLILIAVALFAALSYAITGSSRTSGSSIDKEKAKISSGEMDSYTSAINMGRNRLLLINKCAAIDYTIPEDQIAVDRTCHLFHPTGGGVIYREMGLSACDLAGLSLTDLAVGEACGNVVHAGVSGGNRIYTTKTDTGSFDWSTGNTVTGTTTSTDGLTNTNTILATPGATYPAAEACRALGADWYLPATSEIQEIYDNRVAIGNFGTSNEEYWTSHQQGGTSASSAVRFLTATGTSSNQSKTANLKVRCLRRD